VIGRWLESMLNEHENEPVDRQFDSANRRIGELVWWKSRFCE